MKKPFDEEDEMEDNDAEMVEDEDSAAQIDVLKEIMKMADDSESASLREEEEDPRGDVESSIMIDAKKEKKDSGGGGMMGGGMSGGGGMSMDMDKLKKMKGGFGG